MVSPPELTEPPDSGAAFSFAPGFPELRVLGFQNISESILGRPDMIRAFETMIYWRPDWHPLFLKTTLRALKCRLPLNPKRALEISMP